jgi:hypothetical protein
MGVLLKGCRAPQSRPPSRPPPAGGRNGRVIPPLGEEWEGDSPAGGRNGKVIPPLEGGTGRM